jgi:hypothetical protein
LGIVALMAVVMASCGGATPEAAGPAEGIQVHGDWTIDIYNADGSLDGHTEFSNDLLESGAQILGRLLTGNASTSGLWTINFFEFGGELCPTDVSGRCRISSVVSELIDTGGTTLTETVRLQGSATAETDGLITSVSTNPGTCGGNQAPDACPTDRGSFDFTYTNLADPQPVSAGQVVSIEVLISFTSG